MTICACAIARGPYPAVFRRTGKLAQFHHRWEIDLARATENGKAYNKRGHNSFGGNVKRARGQHILDVSRSQLRRDTRMGRIRPRRIVVEMLREQVDEAADLRRKMVAMEVYGVDGMLRLQKLGQDRNKTAGSDFV